VEQPTLRRMKSVRIKLLGRWSPMNTRLSAILWGSWHCHLLSLLRRIVLFFSTGGKYCPPGTNPHLGANNRCAAKIIILLLSVILLLCKNHTPLSIQNVGKVRQRPTVFDISSRETHTVCWLDEPRPRLSRHESLDGFLLLVLVFSPARFTGCALPFITSEAVDISHEFLFCVIKGITSIMKRNF
jgi:hypothetical protein